MAPKVTVNAPTAAPDAATFAKRLGKDLHLGEQRVIHRRMHKPYKTRVRMPSMLDPHLADIERWLADEPRLTALAILGRLVERRPHEFGPPQHTIVQRLLRSLRRKAAGTIIAGAATEMISTVVRVPGRQGSAACDGPSAPP